MLSDVGELRHVHVIATHCLDRFPPAELRAPRSPGMVQMYLGDVAVRLFAGKRLQQLLELRGGQSPNRLRRHAAPVILPTRVL